jgi:AcrR family transcriptional regulator
MTAMASAKREKPAKEPAKTSRRRRTADEARDEILDAAERTLRDGGPSAIRLQEIAAQVGISHPAVLHHFGSREGLVAAVIDRAMLHLEQDLVRAFAEAGPEPPDAADLLERVARVLGGAGHARLIAWLLLSGYEPLHGEATRVRWQQIAEAIHAVRLSRVTGKKKPSLEDTRFTLVLSSLAMLGEAIAGKGALEAAGFGGDPRAAQRFRKWFGALLERHMESASPSG